ncbi:MAG TPA: succinoglycan biosynthesis ketolase [Cyanobacteria bacterium UBA11149]|nr:succinoglycan biosynthesis ketolase [Cyanobacteria bacterium UBA11367]HBE59965.1 succinoglycan biosynthesis ketolase [Cyanobacteria bacterium UBA11366]HBK63997.1 succinoglycan biosynthesis ketolase [Cyanobacteria bacterium UBA11166]HBR74380.1 succinoglycan biosynthesis ketolase [Cyanobacteria bacterium UBA11159]HBS68342.1 succinoglycan biosynthesis ketolase [Cyanobacteria bacterium UBA11153]HBW87382.1 succinoglycan biosynthesis ketolase [Cyanobacteria bacterium UBA11149]HCA97232.1 succinog
MKLYYCKYPVGRQNFGDNLNLWLWDKLIPGILDDDESTAFVGLGTLINDSLPRRTSRARKRVIFSTGAGYEKGMPEIDSSYKIYCLRGPLSAEVMGVEAQLAVTDGAILVRRLIPINKHKIYKFSYMPHYNFAGEGWKSVCHQLGFGYVDPSSSTEEVLSAINNTEILLSEAMHGVIVADALRVPWIPIVTHPSILSFKWQDWCLSVGLEYQPVTMKRLHQPKGTSGGWAKQSVPQNLDIFKPARLFRDWLRQKSAALEMLRIAKTTQPKLSSDLKIERVTIELEERLQQFKNDVEAGYFRS